MNFNVFPNVQWDRAFVRGARVVFEAYWLIGKTSEQMSLGEPRAALQRELGLGLSTAKDNLSGLMSPFLFLLERAISRKLRLRLGKGR